MIMSNILRFPNLFYRKSFTTIQMPDIIASTPMDIRNFPSRIRLVIQGPNKPPAKEPINKGTGNSQLKSLFRTDQIIKPARQMGISAKVVVAIDAFESIPPSILPLDVTGPKPPPDIALLNDASRPIPTIFHQPNL